MDKPSVTTEGALLPRQEMAIQIDSLPVFYRQRDSLFFTAVSPLHHNIIPCCTAFLYPGDCCVVDWTEPSFSIVCILCGHPVCLQIELCR